MFILITGWQPNNFQSELNPDSKWIFGAKRLMRARRNEVVREALESCLQPEADEPSAYDVAKRAGLIGCAKPLPEDLSTNPKHLAGFVARR